MERRIELPGVFNFRDIGGYRTADGKLVRWRRVFRSGELHRLTAGGIAHLRKEIGVRTVINLRWPDDHRRAGITGRFDRSGVTYTHIPFGSAERLTGIPSISVGVAYLPLAERSGGDAARIASALAEPGALPAVVHCSAGKDRTGVFIALLLALLGVDDATIVADYMLTEAEMPRWIRFLIERGELPPVPPGAPPHPGDALAPDAIQSMLAALRATHGSIEDYFLRYGLADDEIGRLRDLLLE